jgi:hypothetical protein
MSKTFGVVDILVTCEPPEHGLPQHAHERVPAVLTCAGVGQSFAGHHAQAERFVEFALCEQTGVRSHDRTAKLERQPAVEIEPQRLAIRFTRQVRHDVSFQISLIR